ncbi:MFS general substrate transporter [Trametopsis cervina]|nr:MFS general substrate transporter [Trametopsis cervina]
MSSPLSAHDRDEEKTVGDAVPSDEKHSRSASEARSIKEEGLQSSVAPVNPDPAPDGGFKAWSNVIAAGFSTFATFGYINAWGVFQAYYEKALPEETASNIAWIGSLQYALMFVPGLIIGRIFDMGIVRTPLAGASAFLIMSTFLVAECKTYWQVLLCQGVATGLSCGIIFSLTLGVVPHWFSKRKGLAFGLVALGSSIGGTLFPIAARRLIEEVGFPWTMRILAFVMFFALIWTNIFVARRLPPKPRSGPFISFTVFKTPAFAVYCAAGFSTFLGLYTVLTYIDVAATYVGIDDDFSFYLVSIANSGSAFGRVAGGILSDKWGGLNIMIPATTFAGIITFIWPFVDSKAGLSMVGFFYGVSSGVFISLLSAPIVEMGHLSDIGIRLGMFFTVLALGAVAGPPISGAINGATGNYFAVGYYAGSTIFLSVGFLIMTRHLVLHRLWGKA